MDWKIAEIYENESCCNIKVVVPSKLTQAVLNEVCEYVNDPLNMPNGFLPAEVTVELLPRAELEEFQSYKAGADTRAAMDRVDGMDFPRPYGVR